MSVFIPENWMVSAFESLEDYLRGEINNAVMVNNVPRGLDVYELVMDYPDAKDLPRPAEFDKTIIHLAIDDIGNQRLGFGENKVQATFDDVAHTVIEYEAGVHEINFDVGVWASDESGGSSSRLRAYQVLYHALGTEIGKQKCLAVTDGVEIRSYVGGRFVIERPNDVRLYRIIGAELVIRVFSKTADTADVITGDVVQAPELEIDGTLVSD